MIIAVSSRDEGERRVDLSELSQRVEFTIYRRFEVCLVCTTIYRSASLERRPRNFVGGVRRGTASRREFHLGGMTATPYPRRLRRY